MNKKIIIGVTVILLVLLIFSIMYLIDINRMKENKPVVFSTWGYDYTPPEVLEVLEIQDSTKTNNQFICATALEKIFEDSENEYYFNCIKSQYITVKYSNGYEENIKSALTNGNIAIKDLDRFNIGYITQKKIEEQVNSFIGTVLEETTTYMIVVPNEDEIERKSSDKIVISYGENHVDYLYGIGTKVLIRYTGGIMETYPARINTNDVSVVD